ncbi:glycosyltransferase 87 family protein [Mycobacterium sp. OTB74]|jgi:alpha-1,2-mannosyltransferase|uniref:glycosyltransferase 87 family protein n=1 Tax=Mycobacterium sp. OTB74 TaxID=1853452 RepID=UPI002475EFC5|nr:glycosyltransferase 87 family protein [Mycobacterium sp. OTB74]MDH6245958.1 alpha-1,2-mannosyltransferase [Mycobacterium sp. OTB74]
MRIKRSTDGTGLWPTVAWRLLQLLAAVTLIWGGWQLLGHIPYRIDIDVYRMGGRAWLNGSPLYSDGAIFHTRGGLDLPFTYPPLAAIVFAPFAWLPLPGASVAITITTFVLLLVSTLIVLTGLNVWPHSVVGGSALVRRCWLTVAIVGVAVLWLEPVRANFSFGQVNVVLMTLVIADCVPRRTPWARGLLLGVAIALKLTPAVFLLYFLLRRDFRAMLTAVGSAIGATLVGFALAWSDSWEYWTTTIGNTDRIGTATLNTNQNISGTLARFGLGATPRFLLWVLLCFAVLALTVWATHRVLRLGQPVLALMCVAMFGLVVSPVSWSHHWVWALPTLVTTTVTAYRMRNVALACVSAVGICLMVWSPIRLLPEHHETAASLWRQIVGSSYVWWALATIAVVGTLKGGPDAAADRPQNAAPISATN